MVKLPGTRGFKSYRKMVFNVPKAEYAFIVDPMPKEIKAEEPLEQGDFAFRLVKFREGIPKQLDKETKARLVQQWISSYYVVADAKKRNRI